MELDPLFTDADLADFTPMPPSPCIDAGTNPWGAGDGPITDFDGIELIDSNDNLVAPDGAIDIDAYAPIRRWTNRHRYSTKSET